MTNLEAGEATAGCEEYVRWLARRMTRGRADLTDDVAQVIRLRFFRAAFRFDPARGCKFTTFATRDAVHEARRLLRKETRRGVWVPTRLLRTESVAVVTEVNAELTVAPPEAADSSDVVAFWARVREELTPGEWVVVRMRFRDGMGPREINRVLGKCHNYCTAVLKRALPRLAACQGLAGYF